MTRQGDAAQGRGPVFIIQINAPTNADTSTPTISDHQNNRFRFARFARVIPGSR